MEVASQRLSEDTEEGKGSEETKVGSEDLHGTTSTEDGKENDETKVGGEDLKLKGGKQAASNGAF